MYDPKIPVVGHMWGNQQKITIFDMVCFILDMNIYISFQKEVEFIIIMCMWTDCFQGQVTVVIDFKVLGIHELPCTKGGLEVFLVHGVSFLGIESVPVLHC